LSYPARQTLPPPTTIAGLARLPQPSHLSQCTTAKTATNEYKRTHTTNNNNNKNNNKKQQQQQQQITTTTMG